jgi:hypothetical protein
MLIYHYCDPTAFLNIIQSKKLWLSNLANMSDHAERLWAERIMDEELDILKSSFSPEIIQEFSLQYQVTKFSPYICCFSTDGDLLSQWRAYADDGHGFAIGFDSSLISYSKNLPMMAYTKETALSLHSVVYEEEKQKGIIHLLIELALERIRTIQETAGKSVDKISEEQMQFMTAGEMAIQNLAGFAVITKNPTFFEEKEYRLLHMPMVSANRHTNETIAMHFATSELRYRISRKKIHSYFEYDFSALMDKRFIAEIIRGPKNETSDTVLNALFGDLKYKIKFKDSRATYR